MLNAVNKIMTELDTTSLTRLKADVCQVSSLQCFNLFCDPCGCLLASNLDETCCRCLSPVRRIQVETFTKDQTDQRAAAAKKLESLVERMQAVVHKVCEGVKERARAYGTSQCWLGVP